MLSERMQKLAEQEMESSDAVTRELTIEEALTIAIQLQKNEQLAEAELVYSRIIQAAPDYAPALHYSGVLAHQLGRGQDGVALIERSVALVPDCADYYNNLGIVLQALGRIDEGIAAYQRAIALDAGHANAHSNLAVLLRATGKPVESEAAYRTAIRINPEHIDAWTNLGILLNGLKRTEEAVTCFCKVILLRPKHRDARKLLALAHCTLGEVGEAVKIFEEWLAEEPDDPIATHMLAACTGQGIPSRASDGFVEGTFDSFAASFESKLAKLSYRAPALVAAMLEDAGLEPSKSLDALDAGCGTGLCGPLVAPYVRRLTGIDLSAGMLAQAKEKGVYDELLKAELTEYLRRRAEAFDLIISADTLVYFGALDEVVDAAAKALRARGMLIFTVEYAGADGPLDYRLELHGRYAHSRAYVERLLAGAGLASTIVAAQLRMESGVPVAGLVVRATKRSTADIFTSNTSTSDQGTQS
jgi:predicted TPR repeat methyltransferase